LYSKEGRFAIGKIDDAVECLEALLVTIHCEAVGVPIQEGGDEKICTPSCPACEVFKVGVGMWSSHVNVDLLLPN
jgi:hypothetical protein